MSYEPLKNRSLYPIEKPYIDDTDKEEREYQKQEEKIEQQSNPTDKDMKNDWENMFYDKVDVEVPKTSFSLSTRLMFELSDCINDMKKQQAMMYYDKTYFLAYVSSLENAWQLLRNAFEGQKSEELVKVKNNMDKQIDELSTLCCVIGDAINTSRNIQYSDYKDYVEKGRKAKRDFFTLFGLLKLGFNFFKEPKYEKKLANRFKGGKVKGFVGTEGVYSKPVTKPKEETNEVHKNGEGNKTGNPISEVGGTSELPRKADAITNNEGESSGGSNKTDTENAGGSNTENTSSKQGNGNTSEQNRDNPLPDKGDTGLSD